MPQQDVTAQGHLVPVRPWWPVAEPRALLGAIPILPTTGGPLSRGPGWPPTSQLQEEAPPLHPPRSRRRSSFGCLLTLFSWLSQCLPGPGEGVKHCRGGRERRAVLRGGPELGVPGQVTLTRSCPFMSPFLERKGCRCFSRGWVEGKPDPLRTQRLTGGQLPWLVFKVGIVMTLCLKHLCTLYTQH